MDKTELTPSLRQGYNHAVEVIKEAILESQYRAVGKVNAEQLALYYRIGSYVSANSRKGFWGKGAIEYISGQLQKEMPGLRGFSSANIKFMRTFYEEWSEAIPTSQTSTEKTGPTMIDNSLITISELEAEHVDKSLIAISDLKKIPNFPIKEFFSVGFTNHIQILRKAKAMDERLFYIKLCATEHLSVTALQKSLASDEYHHRAHMPSNFAKRITKADQLKRAILAFKDEYQLDFINTEELGVRDIEDVDERVVENLIVHNIKNFIMTFGSGFSFIGNQYHVNALGHDHYIDLLFFQRDLSALVAVELKNGPFKPAYLGQLNTYLRVLDDYVRKPNENKSIGIILCRDADKNYVEYVAQDYDKPMGVAVYRTANEMPERLRQALPDIEELKKLL